MFFITANAEGERTERYIVQFYGFVDTQKEVQLLSNQYDIKTNHVYEHAVKGFSAQLSPEVASLLQNLPTVKLVEKDLQAHTLNQTLPTGVDRINVEKNNLANIDNIDDRVDVDIAILDTGIDVDHPDLNVYDGRNFSTGPSHRYDDGNGHGTHVAGTAAALDNGIGVVGVAPGARLWAVRVLDNNGSGWFSDIIAGVDWVTENADEIEVANMSLGGQGLNSTLRTAIQNSVAAGVFYAVAAGNDSDDVYGADGVFGTSDDYLPASYPEVATISALSDTDGQPGGDGSLSSWGTDDRNGDGIRDGEDDSFAWFSNYARNVVKDNPVSSSGAAIDLLLPGVDIYSTVPGGYDHYSGTSMASPHAAGLAALHYVSEGTRDLNGDGVRDENDVYTARQSLINLGKTQDDSTYGLTYFNDPDSNWENLGWGNF
ncbi:S8 family peptidase [Salirhabdus salicampi]|nr:S8 family peptidase [Salirhabdus salicampi]